MSKTKELAGWWWFESKRQEPVLRINSKLRCVSFENGPLHVRQQYLFFNHYVCDFLRAPSSSSFISMKWPPFPLSYTRHEQLSSRPTCGLSSRENSPLGPVTFSWWGSSVKAQPGV